MIEAAPTPYDLKPIPFFAYEPTLMVWIAAFCALATVLGVLFLLARQRRYNANSKFGGAFERASSDLKRLIKNTNDNAREVLTEASALTKRVLAATNVAELRERSPSELRDIARKGCPDEYRGIIGIIADVDERRWAPSLDPEVARTHLGALIVEMDRIKSHIESKS